MFRAKRQVRQGDLFENHITLFLYLFTVYKHFVAFVIFRDFKNNTSLLYD